MDNFEQFRDCPRVIPSPKIARNISKNYWEKEIEQAENVSKQNFVPIHKKYSNIGQISRKQFLKEVSKILGLDEKVTKRTKDAFVSSEELIPNLEHNTEEDYENYQDYGKLLQQPPHLQVPKTSNMYKNFLLKEERGARWRKRENANLKPCVNLEEKNEQLMRNILKELGVWMNEKISQNSYDENDLKCLYPIRMNSHLSDAIETLKINVQELSTINSKMAYENNMPELSWRATLYKHLYRDVLVANSQENKQFGNSRQSKVPSTRYHGHVKHCLTANRIPEELSSMATVFEGIENLSTTRGFCSYLYSRPDIEPPKYLIDSGLIKPQKYSRASGESQSVLKKSLRSSRISAKSNISVPIMSRPTATSWVELDSLQITYLD